MRLNTLLVALATSLFVSGSVFAQGDTLSSYTFTGDLEGWTGELVGGGSDNWVFSTTGPSGAFAINAIASTTAAGGYALFDSDLLCSGNQNARLVSPALDFSMLAEVEVRWQEYYRRFQDQVFVDVSIDGGATYESIQINENVAVNNFSGADFSENPVFQRVNLTDLAAGQSDVRVAFRFQGGCDYAWMIDDVVFTDEFTRRPAVSLQLDRDFAAFAPNFGTPASQTDGRQMYFLTDVFNDGSATQTDVKVSITIFDANAALIYTDTLAYGDITPDSLAENKAFPMSFPLPTEQGNYRGEYQVFSDSIANEFSPANNRVEFNFTITADEFIKAPVLRTATRSGASPDNYEIANIYYTPMLNEQTEISVDSITFGYYVEGLGDNTQPTFIVVNTYGYKGDLNGDGAPLIGDDSDPDAEFVLLDFNEIELNANTNDGFYQTTVAASVNTDSILISGSEGYIGIAHGVSYILSSGSGSTEDQFYVGVDNRYNFSAFNLAVDTLGIEENFTNFLLAPDAAAGFQEFYNFGNAGFLINSKIRMLDRQGSSVQELATGALTVRPNPVSTELFLDLELDAASEGLALITVRNAVGQEVLRSTQQVTANQTLKFSTAGMNNGLYFLEIQTADNRTATRRFFVNR